MNNICAIIDAQGFIFNKVFYPRELSIVSNELNVNVEVRTDLYFANMNSSDVKTNHWLIKNVIGMNLRSNNPEAVNAYDFLKNAYESIAKNNPNKYFAMKNQQLESILIQLRIPYINLTDCGCPPLSRLYKTFGPTKFCSFHTKSINRFKEGRCSLFKSTVLWKWVTSEL
jgi:hypothetical protein